MQRESCQSPRGYSGPLRNGGADADKSSVYPRADGSANACTDAGAHA